MFCRNCGNNVPDGSRFCQNCGTDVSVYATQAQPQPQPQYQPVNPSATPLQPALGMKWFKFLIYFALWLGAIVNIGTAIALMTGSVYGEDGVADLVYAFFPDLETVDIFTALAMMALAIFGIVTRFRLAHYRKNAMLFLSITYAAGAIINLIYLFAAGSVVSFDILGDSIASTVTGVITSIIMIIINSVYFGKRKHLFVN